MINTFLVYLFLYTFLIAFYYFRRSASTIIRLRSIGFLNILLGGVAFTLFNNGLVIAEQLILILLLTIIPFLAAKKNLIFKFNKELFIKDLHECAGKLVMDIPTTRDGKYIVFSKDAFLEIDFKIIFPTIALLSYTYSDTQSAKLKLYEQLIKKQFSGMLPKIVINLNK